MRRRATRCYWFLILLAATALTLAAQETQEGQPADFEAAFKQHIESYLRYVFAWGPETQVNIGPLRSAAIPGLFTTILRAKTNGQQVEEVILVSADGRYVIRGDFLDTTHDPFAEARQTILTTGYPSKGPADAPVTIVEYGDFQCPTCAQIHPTLKKLLAQRKDVRLVFKDLPLVRMHDWALPAAIAGQCAYQQSNQAFWRLHDYFFENQKQLTAQNLQSRLDTFALQAGLDPKQFSTCRAQELTRPRVEQSLREADQLKARNTPTLFINGRPLIGNQSLETLQHLIAYELSLRQQGTPPR